MITSRIFNAPRKIVWKTWTDPKEVIKWWGPENFTAPHISIDFRVGGKYVYCMRGTGTDGVVKDFWNTGKHLEIKPMEKIVTSMSFADEHGNPVPASYYGMPGRWPAEIMLTVTFEEIKGGKTKITVQEVGIPDEMAKFAGLGWNQSLDKFAESLGS
ncbi:MAG: SRPBCC family protein [Nitrosopumilaceae archaeon]